MFYPTTFYRMNTPVKKTISSKLPNTGLSIFSVMTQLADEFKAINLSQGFPDFMPDEQLLKLVTKHIKAGNNQYAPMPGVLKLREKIAESTFEDYGLELNPETEITITAGATQAIYTAITASIREGDEVIIFEPSYDSYIPAIKLNQGIPRTIELKAPDFKINWNEVKKLLTIKTRMIIINSPHNPTGTMLDEADMNTLNTLITGTDILVLSDEVYEHIHFDEHRHESVARYPALFNQSFIVRSFGKSSHTTGWKIGYCLAPAYLSLEFRRVHQFLVFSVNTPMQYAFAEYLENRNSFSELGKFYQQKRDLFAGLMKSTSFELLPVSGTYFQLASFANFSEEKEKDFAIRLTKEFGVACIPLSAFYTSQKENKLVRFCFAKNDATLEKAAAQLHTLTK